MLVSQQHLFFASSLLFIGPVLYERDLLPHKSHFIYLFGLPFSELIFHRKSLCLHKRSLPLLTCISMSLLSIHMRLISSYRNNYLLLTHPHLGLFFVKNGSNKSLLLLHTCLLVPILYRKRLITPWKPFSTLNLSFSSLILYQQKIAFLSELLFCLF